MPETHEGKLYRFDVEEIERNCLQPLIGYIERGTEWFSRKIIPDLIATKARLNLGENVLDVGCAFGYFTKLYAEHFEKLTGIDFAPSRIKGAYEHNSAPNVEYKVVDLVHGEVPGQYDWAISSAVYQHIDPKTSDRRVAFEKTFAVIPSGSYLVLYDETFDVRPHAWDHFYEPLSPQWIKDNLSDLCTLENFENVDPVQQIFRYELRKK